MKQKNNSSQPVTAKALREELFSFEVKIDLKLDRLKQNIEDKTRGYRDDVLVKLDGVMGELQTMREENTVGVYQTRGLREEVDSHEKRIKHLEKAQQTI